MGCLACSTGLTGGSPETQVGHACGTAAGRPEAKHQAHLRAQVADSGARRAQTHRMCDTAAACMLGQLIAASRQ